MKRQPYVDSVLEDAGLVMQAPHLMLGEAVDITRSVAHPASVPYL